MEKQNLEIHVLLVSFSAQGHINPMLRLGKRLLSKGLQVTLATTEIGRHRMQKFSSATSISGVELAFFSDGLSLDHDRKKDIDGYMTTIAEFGPPNLSKLIHDLFNPTTRKTLSYIIATPFVPWAADVAAAQGVPCALHWIQPCILYAIYYRYCNKLNDFPHHDNPNMSVELPGMPLLNKEDLPSFVLPSNTFSCFTKLLSDCFQNIGKFKWVLANSFYELERDVIESMAGLHPIVPVGPLVPPAVLGEDDRSDDIGFDMWKSDDRCVEWLNRQPLSSVIYVSFGSVVVLSAKQMENIACGLKNSKRPFLWVVKPSDHPVSDGSGQVPFGFSEETCGQGLVVPWCPQIEVLAHPAVACFLTHCGWNSTLEAIACGVPVIAYPQWTDQPTNAKLLVDILEVGLRIRPGCDDGIVGGGEVVRCIEEMTTGARAAEYKKRAAELKVTARGAAARGGSSDRNIQMFVEDIKSRRHATI